MISEELWASIPGNGWLQREEAELLMQIAESTKGPLLEIGCYYGRSTCLLASLNRPVYAVDPFYNFDTADPSGDTICAEFQNNLQERNLHNVELFRCKCEVWKTRPVEFAYLDGDHTKAGTTCQIGVARACGAKELCLHDYDTRGGGLEIARAVWQWPLDVIKLAGTMVHCRFQT